ncbi:MAG: hypothetical protein Fur0032_24420 [Terrimicrobiaceae bacterium]
MNAEDWNYLVTAMAEAGLVAGDPPAAGVALDVHLATVNGIPADESLEWLAGVFHMLPMAPQHAVCSSRGEVVFRRLAVDGKDSEPWLPFCTLGPLLVLAHYNPTAGGMWSIPAEFIIPLVIPEEAYRTLAKDIGERLSFKPLERTQPKQISSPLPRKAGLDKVLAWLLNEYPLEDFEAGPRIESERDALMRSSGNDPQCLRKLPRGLGLALHFLSTGEACFNAEQAPSQKIFPDTLLEKHAVFPLYCGKRVVYLLSEDKLNYAFEDEWLSGGNEAYQFRTVRSDRDSILRTINRDRGRSVVDGQHSAEEVVLVDSDVANVVEIDPADVARINPSSMNATPEQILHWVLHRSVTGRASDLHIEKYYNMARFRARIDGELRVIHSCPEEQLPRFVSLIKNWSNLGQRRQAAEDGRFSMLIGKRRIDGRVSAIPCRKDQQKITIRFLDKQGGIRKLTELNLSETQLGTFRDAMGRDQGLILITGPTGSGKTSTLYALLNSVNAENINIHTVEDPIEYEIEGINQTQTDPINGINFAEGLRRLMRADPDVILIGECRDEETAMAAVTASLTGHLVLTTLHANDSLRAVSRFLSMGVPPYLLADALALSQAQRLVRKLCTYCRQPQVISEDIKSIFRANRIEIGPHVDCIYSKRGCPECSDTGYSGRIALMEICVIDSELSELVATNSPQNKMREVAFRKGFRTLYQQGLQQVLEGNTSMEEISCLSYTAMIEDDFDNPAILPMQTAAREVPDAPPPSAQAQGSK